MSTEQWIQIATNFGPLVIIVPLLVKMHWDMVYKIIPRSFRRMERCFRLARRRDMRQLEAFAQVAEMCAKCAERNAKARPATRPATRGRKRP